MIVQGTEEERRFCMKRSLINWLGLLGVVSLISYALTVIFSPLAYLGYDWMAQAVSDLSAENAPSRRLWSQLSVLYDTCGVVSGTVVCIYIKEKLNKKLRLGIYLFAWMNWVSAVGYKTFPLTEAGSPNGLQNIMHLVVTALVVLLSVISLIVIMIGGAWDKKYASLAVWAGVAFLFMMAGAIGTNVVSAEYFGIPERFSVFAATGFNAVLGVYLFKGIE